MPNEDTTPSYPWMFLMTFLVLIAIGSVVIPGCIIESEGSGEACTDNGRVGHVNDDESEGDDEDEDCVVVGGGSSASSSSGAGGVEVLPHPGGGHVRVDQFITSSDPEEIDEEEMTGCDDDHFHLEDAEEDEVVKCDGSPGGNPRQDTCGFGRERDIIEIASCPNP